MPVPESSLAHALDCVFAHSQEWNSSFVAMSITTLLACTDSETNRSSSCRRKRWRLWNAIQFTIISDMTYGIWNNRFIALNQRNVSTRGSSGEPDCAQHIVLPRLITATASCSTSGSTESTIDSTFFMISTAESVWVHITWLGLNDTVTARRHVL